ncbi:Uncharacterised protein [Candidatus Burarchaeum australiense]|nr:Uncharacterised protein [Candidatus Burarchaeum australiense]
MAETRLKKYFDRTDPLHPKLNKTLGSLHRILHEGFNTAVLDRFHDGSCDHCEFRDEAFPRWIEAVQVNLSSIFWLANDMLVSLKGLELNDEIIRQACKVAILLECEKNTREDKPFSKEPDSSSGWRTWSQNFTLKPMYAAKEGTYLSIGVAGRSEGDVTRASEDYVEMCRLNLTRSQGERALIFTNPHEKLWDATKTLLEASSEVKCDSEAKTLAFKRTLRQALTACLDNSDNNLTMHPINWSNYEPDKSGSSKSHIATDWISWGEMILPAYFTAFVKERKTDKAAPWRIVELAADLAMAMYGPELQQEKNYVPVLKLAVLLAHYEYEASLRSSRFFGNETDKIRITRSAGHEGRWAGVMGSDAGYFRDTSPSILFHLDSSNGKLTFDFDCDWTRMPDYLIRTMRGLTFPPRNPRPVERTSATAGTPTGTASKAPKSALPKIPAVSSAEVSQPTMIEAERNSGVRQLAQLMLNAVYVKLPPSEDARKQLAATTMKVAAAIFDHAQATGQGQLEFNKISDQEVVVQQRSGNATDITTLCTLDIRKSRDKPTFARPVVFTNVHPGLQSVLAPFTQ